MINYTSVQVTDAKLNFDYKIDSDWNANTSSQFSEFRIYINNKLQVNYPNVRFISYNYSEYNGEFIEARSGGYDVTNLIPLYENITLSIEAYIGDDFNLIQPITISIDNVYFVISYKAILPDPPLGLPTAEEGKKGKDTVTEAPWTFLIFAIGTIIGAACLGTYLVAYQLYFKYPKPVRKVRKYRKTLKKRTAPSVDITSRENGFNDKFKDKVKSIKEELKIGPKETVPKKEGIKKTPSIDSIKKSSKKDKGE